VWIKEGRLESQFHHIVVLNQGAEIPRHLEDVIVHPAVQEAKDRTIDGHRNQPNHVQMVGYYDHGQNKEGLEQRPICQCVEGTMGCASETMGGGLFEAWLISIFVEL
jgi:hypothetical protein